jgi:hypothetical protein
MKWISVTDRLPSVDGEYLVKSPNSPFSKTGMSVSGFSASVKPNFQYDRIHIDKVTHWMELPFPPITK